MNSQLVAILAAIAASQARIEGMKAENQHSERDGDYPAYVERHFAAEAHQLDLLSIEARNVA